MNLVMYLNTTMPDFEEKDTGAKGTEEKGPAPEVLRDLTLEEASKLLGL